MYGRTSATGQLGMSVLGPGIDDYIFRLCLVCFSCFVLFTFFEDLRSFWGCNLDLSGGRVGFWLQGEKEIRRRMLAG